MDIKYSLVIKKLVFSFFILTFGLSHAACTNVDPEFDIFGFNKLPSEDDNPSGATDPNGDSSGGDSSTGGAPPDHFCNAARTANSPFANSGEVEIDGLSDDNAFAICTPDQLLAMGFDEYSLQKYYVIKNDIDMGSLGLVEPLGHGSGSVFVGQLNGGGHEIRNLSVGGSGMDYVGLFHGIGDNGAVVNLRFKNPNIHGGIGVGVVAGKNFGGEIRLISVVTAVVNGSYRIGGLVGDNYSSALIEDSFFEGTVSSDGYQVGGVAGYNGSSVIRRVYVVGEVLSSDGDQVGGIVGYNQLSGGIISDSWSRADVMGQSSTNKVGPIVGLVAGGGTVTNSAYDQNALFANTGGAGLVNLTFGAAIDTSQSPNYFYSPGSTQMASWDPVIWFFDGVNHPYLR